MQQKSSELLLLECDKAQSSRVCISNPKHDQPQLFGHSSHKELSHAEKELSERPQETLEAFSAFSNSFEVDDALANSASGFKVQGVDADDLHQ
ncbi:hypothetical protein PoB_000995400 [Plakobranchus ocellatus]|uniref:Uncharacterized protein n=1 Tax=Plakobranchus ocellatus TaxID=259542 RepID=A0AAV3YMW3_9GAST|nr:hypothetical protein PoB_000995400 [Plakobranchus ocellatus]